ncbi:MAG: putative peptidoglycan glycosyltransferase FtsW [Patescibacteria group bacterium]|nr:putative peptidoglycan glycosyltransferase FtsW [Patescibacteria group bacterium]
MRRVIDNLKIDKTLLFLILALLVFGIVIFLSASLGILPNNELKFFIIIKSQLLYVFVFGLLALYIGSRINYKYYKKYSIIIFVLSLLFSLLVFLPAFNFYYNGAHRWIHIFGLSIQPSEILKFASVNLVAFFCSKYSKKFSDLKIGLIPISIFILIVSGILLLQPDFGTLLVILLSSLLVFFIGGAKWRDIIILAISGILIFFLLITIRPYMKERILTFIEPGRELLGSGYQLNQSLIAVGSGQMFGRGIGQSIQKFNYLPEQISDSIFAVYAEEMGFVGSVVLMLLFIFITLRSVSISRYTEDDYGKLLAIGITSIFFFQAFLNISSTIGISPLTGVPLPLISKGGTSLVFLMFQFGVLLNISKYKMEV